MKYSEYYRMVLLGSEIFKYFRGSKDAYNRWEKEVTDWLMIKKKDPEQNSEWESLDSPDFENYTAQYDEVKIFIEHISNRFIWLAKFRSKELPSKNSKVLNDLKKNVNHDEKLMNFLTMGLKCYKSTASYTTHDRFHNWLRQTSDFLQKKSPDTGLSAEWLSLPIISSYYKGLVMPDPNQATDLENALIKRYEWIHEITDLDISDVLKTLNKISKNWESSTGQPVIEEVVKPIKLTVEGAQYKIGDQIHQEAEEKKKSDNKLKINEYFVKRAKDFIGPDSRPLDGEKLLANYYFRRKNDGLENL